MNSKLLLCLALALSGGLFGCSTASRESSDTSNHTLKQVTPAQTTANALTALHVGMTLSDADETLGRFGGIRAFTVSSAARHQYQYVFIPNADEVTLRLDERDKLLSWEMEQKVQN